jgi:putative OmpL-like beta-barrel porin-2
MKRRIVGLALLAGMIALNGQNVRADEDKPLAAGVLSLDSSVGVVDTAIANGKGAVEKALGINISGFLDTSYTWSSNHPGNPREISGRYFDQDNNKVEFNNFHLAVEKPEKDWGVGFRISGDFGRTGELLHEATQWTANGPKFCCSSSAEVQEAYLTTTIPVGEGIAVKGGLFVTPLGTEILNTPGAYNDNISRSFAFNYGIPIRHLGTLFSYPFAKTVTASVGLVTGWDDPHDNNGAPSGIVGVNYTPSDAFGLASNLLFGPEQRHNSGRMRVTWSNVATIKPMDPLAISLEYTLGGETKAPTPTGTQDAYWHALAAIGSWSWTDRFTTALRGEVFFDNQAARTFGLAATSPEHNATLGELTLTSSYKFTKMFMGRAEVRQDFANHGVYKVGKTGADSQQTTIAMQLIYTF